MPKFTLKTGKVIGYDHLQTGKNCQDSISVRQFTLPDGDYQIVFLSDGCSLADVKPEFSHSEVGALLATEFLVTQTESYLRAGIYPPLISIFLYDDLLVYLKSLVDLQGFQQPIEVVNFVKHYLLFTIIGFLVTPKYGLILANGDGLIVLNEEIYTRAFDDKPPYFGYHLIDQKYLATTPSSIPTSFDIIEFDPQNLFKLAIGSDAWLSNLDLIPQFWEHKHPNQIQRNLNIWSFIQHKLLDDATLAVLERKEV